jgi:hypothetical protein
MQILFTINGSENVSLFFLLFHKTFKKQNEIKIGDDLYFCVQILKRKKKKKGATSMGVVFANRSSYFFKMKKYDRKHNLRYTLGRFVVLSKESRFLTSAYKLYFLFFFLVHTVIGKRIKDFINQKAKQGDESTRQV